MLGFRWVSMVILPFCKRKQTKSHPAVPCWRSRPLRLTVGAPRSHLKPQSPLLLSAGFLQEPNPQVH